jgi:hypothetical protein
VRRRAWIWLTVAGVFVGACPAGAVLTPCDYAPVESSSLDLSIQGNGQWYNDPFIDNRNNVLYLTLSGDLSRFYQSSIFGYEVTSTGSLAWSPGHSDAALDASGNAKYYLGDLPFAVGVADASFASSAVPSLDLTIGFGYGRFRDVTPLAQAIRIQNDLLDYGFLLAPVEDDVLLQLAGVLADTSLTPSDQLVRVEEILTATNLLSEGGLGARGLLRVDQLISSPGDPRLCGWDVQARVGVTFARLEPVRDALVLSADYAIVPDPVSQWRFSAQLTTGVSTLSEYEFETNVTYLRRLGDQWRLRSGYDFTRQDPGTGSATDHHRLWGSLLVQLTNRLHLRIDAEIRYGTGDEEMTETLGINVEFDVLG